MAGRSLILLAGKSHIDFGDDLAYLLVSGGTMWDLPASKILRRELG